jgi:D-sedoheptulose 7-phosphate isomerase
MDLGSWLSSYKVEAQALLSEIETSGIQEEIPYAQGIELTMNVLSHVPPKNKVILIGNGGSAGIASEVANRFWKFCHTKAITFNDLVMLSSTANDYGARSIFVKPMEIFLDPQDVLIAISSSGCSENILQAVDLANTKRNLVITLSGFGRDNPLRTRGRVNFYVPSRSYRHVERTHLFILDCIIDALIFQKGEK